MNLIERSNNKIIHNNVIYGRESEEMQMKKKIVAIVLTASFIIFPMGGIESTYAKNKKGDIGERVEIEIPEEYQYSSEEEKLTEQAKNKAKVNGMETAKLVNKTKDNKVFEKMLYDVLDVYYADDNEISEELCSFSKTIDKKAEPVLNEYKAALQERKNAKSLGYDPNGIMVLFDEAVSDKDINKIISTVCDGGEIITGMYETNEELPEYKKNKIKKAEEKNTTKSVWVKLKKNQTTEMAINKFEDMDCVVSASENVYLELDDVNINDTCKDVLWHLNNVNVDPAWKSVNAANNSRIVEVAVIDTGIDMEQPDLRPSIIRSKSADITGDTPVLLRSMSTPFIDEHGTEVAGIISAQVNNSIGVAGIAGINNETNGFKCKIVAIQAYTDSSKGYIMTAQNFDKAVRYAVSMGVDVINISAGTYACNTQMEQAVNYAYEAGITVVASAGNECTNRNTYPSDFEHVISVIASDPENQRASFSNYGLQKDISAPGFSVYSTLPNSSYDACFGTSFSSPIVAATAAMMKGVNEDLTPDDIDSIIKSTATDIGDEGVDEDTAYGLVNTGLAVQVAKHKTFSDVAPVLKGISSVGTGNVQFWCDTIANEEEYIVYRSTSANGVYAQVGRYFVSGSNKMVFSEIGLTSGRTYYYKVRCRCKYSTGSKYSLYSNVVSCTIS